MNLGRSDRQRFVLGLDAGGTKTIACVATRDGEVVGIGRAGCGNFQVTGKHATAEEISKAIRQAVESAKVPATRGAADASPFQETTPIPVTRRAAVEWRTGGEDALSALRVACYGISGADRDKDFDTIHGMLEGASPAVLYALVNDTTIALRAGTKDGIGVGLISGTGTNAIGFNAEGRCRKVGGMGRFLGDHGSAMDIAEEAMAAAQRGKDGRGKRTSLYEKITRSLELERLEDVMDFYFAETYTAVDLAKLCPVVFEAAKEGDAVAIGILEKAGREAALSASVILRDLFRPGEEVPIVLGGSLFQKGSSLALIRGLRDSLPREFRRLRIVKLEVDPVVGAVLFALDTLHEGTLPEAVASKVKASYRAAIAAGSDES